MFAILIAPDTLEKIKAERNLSTHELRTLDMMVAAPTDYYFITGYVSKRGKVHDHTFLPKYLMLPFEYDETKIQTDWDQIVRV